MTKNYAYKQGLDYSKNGPNKENCHYRLFSTKELLQSWEQGRKAGEILGAEVRFPDGESVVSLPCTVGNSIEQGSRL